MSNKFTLASVVIAHLLAAVGLVAMGGCKSTAFVSDSGRSSGSFSGFAGPGETGASGVIAAPASPKAGAAMPAPAAPSPVSEEPTSPASPVSAPAPAPAVAEAPSSGAEPAPAAPEATSAEAKPAPAPSSEIKPVGTGRTHIVKSGESIWVIARREGVSEADLLAANNLKRNTTLRAGQKLTIPASSGKPAAAPKAHAATSSAGASGDVYVVKKGDVLSLIARKLGTTSAALREANGIKGDAIREGQKLIVPSGAKPKAGVTAAAPAAAHAHAAKPAAAAEKPSASAPAPAPAAASGLIDLTPMGGSPSAPAPAPAAAPAAAPAPVPESVEAIPAR